MELNELLTFVKQEHKRLMQHFNFKDKKQMIYPQMLKVMEELGELSEAILHTNSLQRKDKLDSKDIQLKEEFIDVILTTLILAENFEIDIEKELKNKIEKIKNRTY